MNIKKSIILSLAATTFTFGLFSHTANAETASTIEKKRGNEIEFVAPYAPFFSYFYKPAFMGTEFTSCFPWTEIKLENKIELTEQTIINEIQKIITTVKPNDSIIPNQGNNQGNNNQTEDKPNANPSVPNEEKPVEKPSTPAPQPQPEAKPEVKPETKPESTPEISGSLSQFENKVVALTNAERTKAGLTPFKIDTKLSGVARIKSQDMLDKGYFNHNSPTYGSPFDMMNKFDVSYSTAGENIAQGQTTPEEVVKAWMNSSGHRANILNPNFTHIGVGYVSNGNYWTQMFIGK